MKFLWTTINVNNMEESLRFYSETVGLELINRFNTAPGTEISFLGNGETKLELICEDGKNIEHGNAVCLGFSTDSLDEKLKLVKEKGFDIIAGPVQPMPSLKFFIIKDPDGVSIQFVEQM